MNKPKAFLVVSRYAENVDWLKELTDDYIIYNKGESLPDFKEKLVPNFGGNQYDIFHYIYDNYENLPDLIAFLQGDPFDHCLPDRFYKLIYNEHFTPIFGDKNYPDGNYFETNTSWYINAPFQSSKPPSTLRSFDEFMNLMFSDYHGLGRLIFPPGSQIIVEKSRCLFYSKAFWKKLMSIFPTHVPLNREGHIVERAIQIIFENKYKERE